MPEKLLRRRANVLDNLAEQEGGDIASAVHGYSRPSAIQVPKLLVRPSLPYLFEPHPLEYRDHFSRTEDG